MKKIFALLIVTSFILAAVSCANNANTNLNQQNNSDTNTEQTTPPEISEAETPEQPEKVPEAETPEAEAPETEVPENNVSGENANSSAEKLQVISYEKFKEIIGYSMFPYDIPADSEKNMVQAVAGYNGKVELTYFSFTATEDAAKYFDEVMAAFPGEVVESFEDVNYELCKFEDAEFGYMMVRIDNTIIYGSSKNGIEAVSEWMYGLGYTAN